jgi:hypothetical protein
MRLLTVILGSGLMLSAGIVTPTSYNMQNGGTGSYSYWDESYTGSGNTSVDYSPLTGGLGDLTNGVIAIASWAVVEAPPGAGPYVGWENRNPTITFNFASVINFTRVRIHLDDSGGGGGVNAPSSATIAGTTYGITDPAGLSPFWAEFDVTGTSGNSLEITLNRNGQWTFASEFEFQDASAVPEPSTMGVGAAALAAIAFLARRKRCS